MRKVPVEDYDALSNVRSDVKHGEVPGEYAGESCDGDSANDSDTSSAENYDIPTEVPADKQRLPGATKPSDHRGRPHLG